MVFTPKYGVAESEQQQIGNTQGKISSSERTGWYRTGRLNYVELPRNGAGGNPD